MYKVAKGAVLMGKHVLIIEDEPNIVEAISFLLQQEGCSVTAHSDGANAVDRVIATSPDVLILDLMLPGRSGFDILRDLRADAKMGALPVLVLTAKGQESDRNIAESIGVACYMTKPFSNQEMLAAVRALLS